MNQQEREAFEEELCDELAGAGFRTARKEDGSFEIVVNDVVKACMPAILSRIDKANDRVPKKARKKVSIKDKAWRGYVAGWRDGRRYSGAVLDEAEAEQIREKFGEWWEKDKGE